jgi:ABC-type branched-subunit amino acid transport system ATPase component
MQGRAAAAQRSVKIAELKAAIGLTVLVVEQSFQQAIRIADRMSSFTDRSRLRLETRELQR